MILRRRIMVLGGDKASQYLTFKSVTNCTHKFTKAVNYSLNGGTTWKSLAANTTLTVTAGNSVMWKATLSSSYDSGIGRFQVTSDTMRFDVEGNPMSLLYGDNFIGQTDITGKIGTFCKLFNNNKGVVDAQNVALPATTLARYCYQYMFQGCTSLTTAPVLPATTLIDSCYFGMFSGCTSLTTAPALPATTLEYYCYYQMFYGCTSLTTAPALPVTALAIGCYYRMFQGCTSLTSAPVLPATTLTNDCYQYMFYGCTSLNYIRCMATDISAYNCLESWTYGVAASGTFVKDLSMSSWPTGSDGIPSNWTVQDA